MCSQNHLYNLIISVLNATDVVYRDCNGVIQGDCGLCGSGGGGPTTNTVTFNTLTNVLTTTVNGVAATATISLDAGDVVTTSAMTIGVTTYPIGTSVQTILTALNAARGMDVITPTAYVDLATQTTATLFGTITQDTTRKDVVIKDLAGDTITILGNTPPAISAKTANYTFLEADSVIEVDTTASAVQITVPNTLSAGKQVTVIWIAGSNACSVTSPFGLVDFDGSVQTTVTASTLQTAYRWVKGSLRFQLV